MYIKNKLNNKIKFFFLKLKLSNLIIPKIVFLLHAPQAVGGNISLKINLEPSLNFI